MTKKLVCKECDKAVANSNNVLARHIRSAHSIEWQDYVVKHEYDGIWPECQCGCGETLPWKKGGFAKFIKGHENRGDQNPMAQKRETKDSVRRQLLQMEYEDSETQWLPNPWTGQEECMDNELEHRLFLVCVEADDPITKDHNFRIGWEDSTGKLQLYVPSFRHLKERIIFDLEGFHGVNGSLRLAGIKDWCDQHDSIMLSLRLNDVDEFDVVWWYKGRK